MADPFPKRIWKKFSKTVTFDGTAGAGAQGTVAIATVTGRVALMVGGAYCSTNLAGTSATVEVGVSGNTAALIAQTTATDIDAGEFWQDATPEAGVSPAIVNKNVAGNIILTVATADVTAGVLDFDFYWLPLSSDGNLG